MRRANNEIKRSIPMTSGIKEVTCDATIGAAIVIKHVDNGMNCRVRKNSAAGTKIPSALICWAKASIAIRTLHDVRTFLNLAKRFW